MRNTLYYGDNLQVLRDYIPAESVDLVYLDPPFNSNASYNVLFREETGEPSSAQIRAFDDTWKWTEETERTYELDIYSNPAAPESVKRMVEAVLGFLGRSTMTAYLVMMAPRLVELHRVLKPTGSLYLHCDPTSSHYLKVLLDAVFGGWNFRNEVVWRRTNAHNNDRIYDILLFYSKRDGYFFSPQTRPYFRGYVESMFRHRDETGLFRYADATAPEVRTGDSGRPWNGYDPTEA